MRVPRAFVTLLFSQILANASAQSIPFYTQHGYRTSASVESANSIRFLNERATVMEERAELQSERLSHARQMKQFLEVEYAQRWSKLNKTQMDSVLLTPEYVDFMHRAQDATAVLPELVASSEEARIEAEEARLKADSAKTEEATLKDQPAIEAWHKERTDSIRLKYGAEFARIQQIPDNVDRKKAMIDARKNRTDAFRVIDQHESDMVRSLVASSSETGWFWIGKDCTRRRVERYFEPYSDDAGGFLQSNTLNLNPAQAKASVYSELYHDYFGPLRFGLGGQLSTSTAPQDSTTEAEAVEESQEDLAQRILGGGGSLTANITLPAAAFTSDNGMFSGRLMLQSRFSLDLQGISSDSSVVPYNGDIGIELDMNTTGSRGVISGFFSYRPSVIIGNPAFYDRLNRGGYSPIMLHQFRFGIGISNAARISYLLVAGDDFVRGVFRSLISVQILTASLTGK